MFIILIVVMISQINVYQNLSNCTFKLLYFIVWQLFINIAVFYKEQKMALNIWIEEDREKEPLGIVIQLTR